MGQIMLPERSVVLHERPTDMALQRIVNRMYGRYNVRPGYMYPDGPVQRVKETGIGGLRGLGMDYYGLLAQAGLENCDPHDTACVSNNTAKQAAVEDYWVQHMATGVPDNTVLTFTPQTTAEVLENYNPTDLANSGNVLDARGVLQVNGQTYSSPGLLSTNVPLRTTNAPPATAGGYSPRVSFSTSTGDTGQLKPGDTWVVRITGGQPGAQVMVIGGQNGRMDHTPMGTTDGSGNWQASGSIDTSMLGNWSEQWTVGGTSAGSFSFTVVAATQAQGSANSGKPNQNVPPGNSLTPGNTGFDKTADKLAGGGGSGGTGSGTPATDNTMLLVAAGLAALFLMTRR